MSQACTSCEDECGAFLLRLNYRIIVETWLQYPKAKSVAVSRDLYMGILEIFPVPASGVQGLALFDTLLYIDDALADSGTGIQCARRNRT